jgi:hypothetical protein
MHNEHKTRDQWNLTPAHIGIEGCWSTFNSVIFHHNEKHLGQFELIHIHIKHSRPLLQPAVSCSSCWQSEKQGSAQPQCNHRKSSRRSACFYIAKQEISSSALRQDCLRRLKSSIAAANPGHWPSSAINSHHCESKGPEILIKKFLFTAKQIFYSPSNPGNQDEIKKQRRAYSN